ncbi:MAG: dihydrolipoyl dehydrogenase [Candidatus Aminicenantes bacterium]|nr:MAG: dihydrolipoyl dehydrogenase [Candidatus Aminicenantes bacterium]
MNNKYDLAIIGGGPGGYVAALRGAQLKQKVVLFEKDRVGGTCMNRGCIPAKFLLHQTKIFEETKNNKYLDGPLEALTCNWEKVQEQRKKIVERFVRGIEFLLKKNGIQLVLGDAKLRNEKQIEVQGEDNKGLYEAERIILATGSKPATLPFLQPDSNKIITSKEGLELAEIPDHLVIVGAGAIGLEMGVIYHRLGSQVTIIEIMPDILPGSDQEMTKRLERILKSQGLNIHTEMEIQKVSAGKEKMTLESFCLKENKNRTYDAQKVLLAVGRVPNSEDFLQFGTSFVDEKGFVKVNAYLETKMPGVYAIGDLNGGKLLAHKASHEGVWAAENASGLKKTARYHALPMAVYTEPEFSSVGLTEQQARERGLSIHTGVFSFQANGRALTMGKPEGMAKVIADDQDTIIGAHILGPSASELLAELTLCMEKGMKLQDVSSVYHIHPTLSETVMEAALSAKGEALHILNT